MLERSLGAPIPERKLRQDADQGVPRGNLEDLHVLGETAHPLKTAAASDAL